METPARRRWPPRPLRALGFCVYFVLIVAASLEIGCRLFLPQVLSLDAVSAGLHVADPFVGWGLRPRARATINWQGEPAEVCTDELGERVSCLDGARTCERRILALGDSFVEALAIPYEKTVWSLLERDTARCVQVSAAGGWGPAQYARRARQRLGSGHYDLVILSLFVGNDFHPGASRMPHQTEVSQAPLRLLPRSLHPRAIFNWFYPINQWLEMRSHAYVAIRGALRKRLRKLIVPDALQPSRLTPEVVAESLEPVREIAHLTRDAHTPLLVVLIPMDKQVLDPLGVELRQTAPQVVGDLDMDLTSRRVLPALLAIPGVHVLDLLPALRAQAGPGLWGALDAHFSSTGHALWFQVMRPPVRRLLALDAPPPAPPTVAPVPGAEPVSAGPDRRPP